MKELIDLKNDNILPFKFKKLTNGKYFLVNDIGQRLVMSGDSFLNFINGDTPEEHKKELQNKGFLLKEDTSYEETIKNMGRFWLNRHKYMLSGPSLHIMVLTLACNHACRYCHASAKMNGGEKYHMSKEYAKKVVDVIFQTTSGTINIEFQGGEPLTNWEVLKFVVDYAREKNETYNLDLRFSLVSNLTLMDDEKIDFLMAQDINISTSIDGPKDVHDWNRLWNQDKSSFDEVSNMIKKINEKYKENDMNNRVGAITTVTKRALDRPKDIVDTYINLGLDTLFVRQLDPYGFAGKVWDKIGYTSDEYNEFYNKLMEYLKQKQKEGININDTYSESICGENMKGGQRVDYMEERTPCGATLGQVAYDWTGKIYTCDEGRMLAATGDESFCVSKIDLDKKPEEIYKEMIFSNVTNYLAYSSVIDYVPGYDTDPISSFVGLCPIYSYSVSGNLVSKYKKENRYNIQSNVIEKIAEE